MATQTRQLQTSISLDGFASWVEQARQHLRALGSGPDCAQLFRQRDALSRATQRELSKSEFIEEYAQAVACGRVATRAAYKLNQTVTSLLPSVASSPLIAASIAEAIRTWPPVSDGDTEMGIADTTPLAGLYEPFLGLHHRQRRSRNGVYYTPGELAAYIDRKNVV